MPQIPEGGPHLTEAVGTSFHASLGAPWCSKEGGSSWLTLLGQSAILDPGIPRFPSCKGPSVGVTGSRDEHPFKVFVLSSSGRQQR